MNVVISGENRVDDYGNFFFKDKAGNEHKIGEKRKNQTELIDLIENNPGKAVSFTYAEFNKVNYIVGVELVSEQLTDESVETPPDETPKPQLKPQLKPTEKPPSRLDNIDKRCALIQVTELIKDGKIGLSDWERWAIEFYLWLIK